MRIHHDIKCIDPYFTDVKNGLKLFEIRKNDRNYQKGQTVLLRQFDPEKGEYSGNWVLCKITCLPSHEGITPGYCVFGIKIIKTGRD